MEQIKIVEHGKCIKIRFNIKMLAILIELPYFTTT